MIKIKVSFLYITTENQMTEKKTVKTEVGIRTAELENHCSGIKWLLLK